MASPALRVALVLVVASLVAPPANAIVGASKASSRTSVVMVLHRDGARSGFCSGVVIAQNRILTAAHCVGSPDATRVHFRDGNGAPVLIPVARVTRHSGYRADAVEARAKSVDLALVETREPLPAQFSPATIANAATSVGASFAIAGYGVAQEGNGASSGILREATLTLRAPISNLLLWLDGDGAGACTGDSGAPVFDSSGTLVGIVAFAQGKTGRGCGGLTQAVRVAPFREWVESQR